MAQLRMEWKLSNDQWLTVLQSQSAMPWSVTLEYVSFERLRRDDLFASNIMSLTGFPVLEAVEAFF